MLAARVSKSLAVSYFFTHFAQSARPDFFDFTLRRTVSTTAGNGKQKLHFSGNNQVTFGGEK
jgi:hypothetical protein